VAHSARLRVLAGRLSRQLESPPTPSRSKRRMRKLLAVLALAALPLFAAEKPAPPADLNNPPTEAVRSADGLVSLKLADGTGTEHLGADDFAVMRYTVWKPDGTLVQHVAAPLTVTLGVAKMIPGWGTAVREMVVGEK